MKLNLIDDDIKTDAPTQPDQEWVNALTHGFAAIVGLIAAIALVFHTANSTRGTMLSCLAFVAAAICVFVASTLSHTFIHDPDRLKVLRAWDQGLIYAMISGTYTPLVYRYADESQRDFVLIAIWVAAAIGFYSKVFAGHRINSIGTVTYLALGWLPTIPLIGRVPTVVLVWMAAGGVIYTFGVVVLKNDSKLKYLHAVWHLMVMAAAGCHYWAIYHYVAGEL